MIWGGADVITTEPKCTMNVMFLNHLETIPCNPSTWKNCLPWNRSLLPTRLGTAALEEEFFPASPSLWWPPMVLGLWQPNSHLCLHLLITFSLCLFRFTVFCCCCCFSMSVSEISSYQHSSHNVLGTTLMPSSELDEICREPIST